MTNRKIKNYHKNKLAYDVICENYRLLCIIMLVLRRNFPKEFYPKKINEWLEEYVESCKMANGYDADGAYNYKMAMFTKKYGISDSKCIEFVNNHCKKFAPQNRKVLAENVKLALVQTASDFGFGKQRIVKLEELLCESDINNPVAEIEKLGIKVDLRFDQVDYKKLQNKKERTATYQEGVEAQRQMAALKAYQDEIMQTTSIGN